MVEFALALPILIILLVALFDLGFGFYQALQVEGAAAAGAQYASLHQWNRENIKNAVRTATNVGTQVTPDVAQVCGCTDNANNFTQLPDPPTDGSATVLGDCSSHTCPDCTTVTGAVCPAGVYASVSAELPYTPVLPYPGLPNPVMLGSQAYRRLK
ncbi:MAG: TadE/TadG family type IV pilus assembly protein [Thiohalocapsa sp.]